MKRQFHPIVVTCGVADVQYWFQITVAQVVVLAASNDKCVVQRAGVVTHDGVLGRIQQHSVQASILSIANARIAPGKHKVSQNGGYKKKKITRKRNEHQRNTGQFRTYTLIPITYKHMEKTTSLNQSIFIQFL